MSNKPKFAGALILEYLEKFPDMANMTLAKKIYKENEKIFLNVDNVRSLIRYYKGSHGDKHRKKLPDKYKDENFADPKIWDKDNDHLEEKIYAPYTLPTGEDNILILPDIHIPYHDPKALKVAIDYGLDEKVNTIILSGDQTDFYGISDFVKKPHKPSIKLEIDLTRAFFKDLRETFPNARIYAKEGNHEERYYRYLLVKAPELFDLMINELDDLLQMTAVGITPIKDRRRMIVGDYSIFHGHELNVSSMQYPAAALWRKAKVNAICGHLHRSDTFSSMDVNKKRTTCHVMGCLSTLLPEYAQYNAWNHGFAHIKVKNGRCSVNNIVLEDYRIV